MRALYDHCFDGCSVNGNVMSTFFGLALIAISILVKPFRLRTSYRVPVTD